MRLVAAARVRRAQEAVLKSRPLLAQLQLVYKTVLNACNQEDIELPILEVREVKKVALVLSLVTEACVVGTTPPL